MSSISENIENYGWHVVNVLGDEMYPSFSYSVGFYDTFGHPEVIFIGLKTDLAHLLINNIGETIREGFTFQGNVFYSNILDNFQCKMIPVDEDFYGEYVGRAVGYYNQPFPLLQCVYPTVTGVFPWEEDWPEDLRELQPILREFG